MGRLGPVSRDYLIASDERAYAAMERGSTRLRHAIEDYWIAKAQHRAMRPAREFVTDQSLVDEVWDHEIGSAVRQAARRARLK